MKPPLQISGASLWFHKGRRTLELGGAYCHKFTFPWPNKLLYSSNHKYNPSEARCPPKLSCFGVLSQAIKKAYWKKNRSSRTNLTLAECRIRQYHVEGMTPNQVDKSLWQDGVLCLEADKWYPRMLRSLDPSLRSLRISPWYVSLGALCRRAISTKWHNKFGWWKRHSG